MFKNILIPISSEYYSKNVLKRSVLLAEKFKSKITLIYIIEEKTLNQTNKIIDSYRTPPEIEETKKAIILRHKLTADNIIFNDAKLLFKTKKIPCKEKIVQGEFSDVIKRELEIRKYDLILMGFEKECLLNYRLLEDVDVPVWVESGHDSNKILAVLTNLSPNQKVPNLSIELSKILSWDLQMIYVVDREDAVQVNEKGERSGKKAERDLLFFGQKFIQDLEDKGIKVDLLKGSLERQTIKKAKKMDAGLIIVGREQKKKGVLGVPIKNLRRKIAEKCKYSLLFIK
jgi:hypothetical protein